MPLENYTTWEKEVKGSESHQRVIQYFFGGLKCLVRFECDGYLEDLTTSKKKASDRLDTRSDHEDIVGALEAVSVSQRPSATGNLTLKVGGSEVPQESVFDLKTRSGRHGKQINMEDQLPPLWVRQVPNFVVAYHDGAGLFEKDKIQILNVREDIQGWEKRNTAALKRMVALIRKIVDFAKCNDEHRIDVYCPSVDRLEIRKQMKGAPYALPPLLRTRWATMPTSHFSAAAKRYGDTDEAKQGDGYSKKNINQKDYGIPGSRNRSTTDDGGVDLNRLYAELIDGKYSDDHEEELDYTACSAEDCGYCGRCYYN